MQRMIILCSIMLLALAGCRETPDTSTKEVAGISAPTGSGPTREEMERERFSEGWRTRMAVFA